MPPRNRPPKPEKPREPEYVWGDTPAGPPTIVWEYPARPLWVQAMPERDGALLMERERMRFVRVSTGAPLWEQPLPEQPDEVAQDARGLILAGGAHLRELDPETGAQRWRQRPGGPITGLALDPAAAYVTTQGPLFALERADGSVRWRAASAWEPELDVHPDAGLLVVSDSNAEKIQLYRTADGARRWEYSADGQPLTAGPLTQGLLVLSCHADGAAGLDGETGEVRWRLESEGVFEAPGVALGDCTYLTDGTLYAVDTRSGAVQWRHALEDEDDKVFVVRVDGDLLLAETWRGRLLAIDPADGSIRWERLLGQVHGMAADSRRLYLRVDTARAEAAWAVLSVDRSTGDLLWELRARRMVPDLTLIGGILLIELKNQVLAVRPC
jgi:outer membrane protein assembly factor BamB